MKRPLILLVEDNPDEAELLRVALQENAATCDLHVAEDGQAALEFVFGEGEPGARGHAEELKLVLLDLKLPGFSGEDILKALKSDPRSRHIPVVVLTSSNLPADVASVYAAGANAYLRKPVTLAAFVRLIGTTIEFWLSPEFLLPERR
jgi:CheY-like chemotaxis protein